MKKIVLVLSIVLLLASCSSDSNNSPSPSSSNSGVYKWSFKLDGVLYQWQGTLQNPGDGGGQYSTTDNIGNLYLNADVGSTALIIYFPNVSTGTFTFNSSSPVFAGVSLIFQDFANPIPITTYDTDYGGTMNVNITSISSNTIAANPTNPGKVIGTFSGTIKKSGSQTIYTISEGVFEVWRAN
jgi:hypothetical protein